MKITTADKLTGAVLRVREMGRAIRRATPAGTSSQSDEDIMLVTSMAEVLVMELDDIGLMMRVAEVTIENAEKHPSDKPDMNKVTLRLRECLHRLRKYIDPSSDGRGGALAVIDHRDCPPGCGFHEIEGLRFKEGSSC